jgi:glutamate synthase domain-containing protein 3
MHGGAIFVRQSVDEALCSTEVILSKPDDKDMEKILVNVKKFCSIFRYDCDKIINDEFVKITPKSKRPYGNLYIPGP